MATLRSTAAVIAVALSVLAPRVEACEHWQLSGPFTIHQSNRLSVEGVLSQQGRTVSGNAHYFSPTLGDGGTPLNGTVDGQFNGNQLDLTVYWYGTYEVCEDECYARDYNAGGRYIGTVDADGTVSGLNYALDRPHDQVRWRLQGRAVCTASPPDLADLVRDPGPIALPDRRGAMVRESSGYARTDKSRVIVSDQSGFGAPPCRDGYVWRQARANDHVCVLPEVQLRTQRENDVAGSRRDPSGAYGADSCYAGFVWREAFPGDTVCVSPEMRDAVREDNAQGPSRVAQRGAIQ